MNDFDGKLKMIVDMMKIFNGWIGSTDTADNEALFAEKATGKKYIDLYSSITSKNHPEETFVDVMTLFERGLAKKVSIVKAYTPEQIKEIDQDTVLGLSHKTDKSTIEKASSNTTRGMTSFKDTDTVQQLGSKILEALARLSDSNRNEMNKSGVPKSPIETLNNTLLNSTTHCSAIKALDELSKGDDKNIDTVAKFKGLNAIFNSLKYNPGNDDLKEIAEPLIEKLMNTKEGTAFMKEDMIRRAKELEPFKDKSLATEESEMQTASDNSSKICDYMMNETLANLSDEDSLRCAKNLKDFWEFRRMEKIELGSTGKRTYRNQDLVRLADGAQRIVKHLKPNDTKNAEGIKASGIISESAHTFKNFLDDKLIISGTAKLLN